MELPLSRMGCDIGGTFTDFVLSNPETGEIAIEKILTTPDDPSRAVLQGFDDMASASAQIGAVVHATTLVVNSVVEAKGSVTGLITTRGFRDVLELRRHMRTQVFDIYGDPAPPLVPRPLRLEVDERVLADGEVLTPLSEEQVIKATIDLVAAGVRSIAVVYLHSYANPSHERRTRELIQATAPGVEVSLSSEVLPLLGEFARTSTTVINAYTKPLTREYLMSLQRQLHDRGVERFHVMSSDGGLSAAETLMEFPCRMIESGPVAGVMVALKVADAAGRDHLLSFDMGGTTAKICLVKGGKVPITTELETARTHRFRKGSGYPVSIPSVDLVEIGAGGGSIAHINSLGLVEVGPESASARPGPACYALGGTAPTVTDADLVLGYLSETNFLGGRMRLDASLARDAIVRDVGTPLGIGVEEAAWRIHEVANEMMAHAVRRNLVESGGGDEVTTLVAFGGAGPVHAYNLATNLGIREVLIPVRAGVASAAGLLAAPVAFHLMRSKRMDASDVDGRLFVREFEPLRMEAGSYVVRALPGTGTAYDYSADLRYRGQGYEVRIELDPDSYSTMTSGDVVLAFYKAYESKFGYFYDDIDVELVNLHLTAIAPSPDEAVLIPWTRSGSHAPNGERAVWNPRTHTYDRQAVVSRYALAPKDTVEGPAVIEEDECTTVIGQGSMASVDRNGTLRITIGEVNS